VADPTQLEIHGAQSGSRFTPLATVKFIGGLQTQRSPFASIDTRYNSRFLGGKPDALIDGSNVEISNSLTLQRRFGISAFGTPQIPPPLAFFAWTPTSPPSIQLVVDTPSAVYNYSPTAAGIFFYKSPGAGQTNFWDVVNTLYCGNGVDLFKIVGPNLLVWSNTFTNPIWRTIGTGSISFATGGQFDPFGGTQAVQATFSSSVVSLDQKAAFFNTPIASNTFTFSVYLRAVSDSPTISLGVTDETGAPAALGSSTIALTQTWTRYQVTASSLAGTAAVGVFIGSISNPAIAVQMYGAQLEVGGPATPLQNTTNQPLGVYQWGINAPTVAPVVSSSPVGLAWQSGHVYSLGDQITDPNGNLETVTTAGTSGGSIPTFATLPSQTTTDNTVVWTNGGPNGLTPQQGYQWYFAYIDQYTGQPSNVSPISPSTTTLPNNLGVAYTLTGPGSPDPQVNQVGLYRNTDGGPFFFQVAVFANPPNGGTWSYVDTMQDTGLNSRIYAPIGLLNTPPPAGAVNPTWHKSRFWVSVGANLYYSAGPDNAALLNINLNAVTAESFPPANVIPLDEPIVRHRSISSGLMVWTTNDIWLIVGSDLTTFDPVKILEGHGIRSFNAVTFDGSTSWMHTSDRQFLTLSPSSGSLEIGFPVGDLITNNFDPSKVYVARHVGGSLDNAAYLADGATGWLRVNPNQVGASVSGEPSPVFSPFATITNGAGAVASIETTPGIKKLLIGAPVLSSSAVLSLGQNAGSGANFGSGTAWTSPSNVTSNNPATPASVILNVATSSGVDVKGGAQGSSTTPSSGSLTTTQNNELAFTAIMGNNVNGGTSTVTAGSGWTVDYSPSAFYKSQSIPYDGTISFYYVFGAEHQALPTAGAFTGNATLSRSNSWSVSTASFVAGSGSAPTIVQQKNVGGSSSNPIFSVAGTLSSNVTLGNYLVVVAGSLGGGNSISVTDSLGNLFTAIRQDSLTAIFLAPITTAGADTVTVSSASSTNVIQATVYEITLPISAATLNSQFLQAENFNLNVPTNNITGVRVLVTGSQSTQNPDAVLTVGWISPVGASPVYTFQLPLTSGVVSFGSSQSTWGQTLNQTTLNSSSFGFQVKAFVTTSTNVTFNVSAIQVQVSYVNGTIATFPIFVRDLSTFADNGTLFSWSATLGSLVLASSGTLAEVESITTETKAASGIQPGVSVLLDEISGTFESLPKFVPDPPQLIPSSSVIANRFYLSQGATPPLCKHLQIKLSGGATNTKDELLSLTIRGALVPEQT